MNILPLALLPLTVLTVIAVVLFTRANRFFLVFATIIIDYFVIAAVSLPIILSSSNPWTLDVCLTFSMLGVLASLSVFFHAARNAIK